MSEIQQVSNRKNDMSDSETDLKDQLQQTKREFQEYKNNLFKQSDPKDLKKIEKLALDIASKDKKISESVETIKFLENKLLSTKKKEKALEIALETLATVIETKKNLSEVATQDLRYLLLQEDSQELSNNQLLATLYESLEALGVLANSKERENLQLSEVLNDQMKENSNLEEIITFFSQSSAFNQKDIEQLISRNEQILAENNDLTRRLEEYKRESREEQRKLDALKHLSEITKEQTQIALVQYSLILEYAENLEEKNDLLSANLKKQEKDFQLSEAELLTLHALVEELNFDNIKLQNEKRSLLSEHNKDLSSLEQKEAVLEARNLLLLENEESLSHFYTYLNHYKEQQEEAYSTSLKEEQARREALNQQLGKYLSVQAAAIDQFEFVNSQFEETKNELDDLKSLLSNYEVQHFHDQRMLQDQEDATTLLKDKYEFYIQQLHAELEAEKNVALSFQNHLQAILNKQTASGIKTAQLESKAQHLLNLLETAEREREFIEKQWVADKEALQMQKKEALLQQTNMDLMLISQSSELDTAKESVLKLAQKLQNLESKNTKYLVEVALEAQFFD